MGITISGTFMDQAETIMESDILIGFTRVFILKAVESGVVGQHSLCFNM